MARTGTDTNLFEIRLESASALGDYASIPASFEISAVLDVARQDDRFTLTERRLQTAIVKDYDAIETNSPRAWSQRFQLAEWGFFSARRDGAWVGAAAVAMEPALAPGASKQDAVLWDLRVAPSERGRGIGSALFTAVERWARARRALSLLAETQHINVAACRLYESQGCVLAHVDPGAYPEYPDEVRLVWRKRLGN